MLDECTLQIKSPLVTGVTSEGGCGWIDRKILDRGVVYDLMVGNLYDDSPRLPPAEI